MKTIDKSKVSLEPIDENIVETTSTFDGKKCAARYLRRQKRKARRAARKRAMMNKRNSSSVESAPKTYTVLVQYHQLNYPAIQEELKKLELKPTVIDKTRFWANNVDADMLAKLKEAMRSCHFETTQHKQYKVRLAAYKALPIRDAAPVEKASTNNKPDVAAAAKRKRKAINAKIFVNRGRHLIGRKADKPNHKPAVLDTSSVSKKLRERIKKAQKAIERVEKNNALQAKSRAPEAIQKKDSKKHSGKQLEIAA